MIEKLCRAINLEPVYIEPGCCLREFETESVQLEYKILDIYKFLVYKDLYHEIKKIRDKALEDLANISYKGKVYYTSSNVMDWKWDGCTYIWFDCLKITGIKND